MEKTGKQRRLYFMRVSENCQLLTELYVVPDEFSHQQGWFEDRHLQEIVLLLRDPIRAKVVSYYEQRRRKKWPGIQEGNDSKKKPVEDEHQITTGTSVKIGYKFVDSNLHHHSCLMPTEVGTPVWKDNNFKHSGGGFSSARLFAKKLVVFVCNYHPANTGQVTSQLMRSMCATPPSKHIAISSYFAPKADDDFVGPPVTESANRKRNRLRKIVKGKNTAAAVGSKESTENRGRVKGGGFFEKDSGDTGTETAKEIKREDEQYPSVSDMDCNSDGMPDAEEQKDRPEDDPRSTECKDGKSFTRAGHLSSSRPLSPQEEKLLKITVSSRMKPDETNTVDGRDPSNQSDVSKPSACKLENMEEASADSQKEADVPSSEGISSLPFHRSGLNDSLKSIKSEVTEQSSSVGQESGVTKLTWTSEVTESSPSSSGDFDQKPRRKQDAKSRNKLSLKRGETKKGVASKVKSSVEKVLLEDAIKESAEEVSVDHKVHTEIEDRSVLTLQLHKVAVKRGSNISKTGGHASGNCSVVLTDIKSDLRKSWKSPLKRPLTNQPEIPSPDKEITPTSSSDDELMSASFLYTEKRPMELVEEVKDSKQRSPVQASGYEDRRKNGEMDSACSSSSELTDTFHLTVNASKENTECNENPRRRGLKQSKLALSNRQKNIYKDEVHDITKEPSHGEKRCVQKTKIQKLMEELDWDSDSQGTSQIERTSKAMNSRKVGNRVKDDAPDEPMEVEDALPETAPVEDVECLSDEVEALSSEPCRPDDNREASTPELKQDNLVDISDDSCGGDARETKQGEEGGNAQGGAGQEGDLDDEVIDLSQGGDDEDESDGLENTIGNVRLVTELKITDIAYLTQRNKKYLHNIFQGKIVCERHQCYKKKGPHRVGMASNVRLGPFNEEQMDAVMGELVKVYCAKHFKYMDYLSKVLLPEAMTKIYMDVHGVSHSQAEEVMKGMQKEHPRTT